MSIEITPRRPVYIAGPFAAPAHTGIQRNVDRAVLLGQLATRWGLAPIVPHAMGRAGCHGSWDESAPGVREAALGCGVALARLVGSAGGNLWVILHDDQTRSQGTLLEDIAWHAARTTTGGGICVRRTWEQWRRELRDGDVIGGGRG